MGRMVTVFAFEEPESTVQLGLVLGVLKENFQDFIDVKTHIAKSRAADYIMEFFETGEEVKSPLVEHAKRELALIDPDEEDDGFKESIVKAIQGFVSYGHSGGSAGVAIHMIHDLLQNKNLTPLTDDPKEWMLVGSGAWQNVRNGEAFSQDGGKTYYLLSEGANEKNPQPLHKSEPKPISEESKD